MPVEMRGRHYTGPQIPAPPRPLPEPPPPKVEAPPPPPDTALGRAFARFRKTVQEFLEPEIETLLQEAFSAGYSAALHPPIEELAGTKTSRTIAAALKLFKDFVLTQRPEEATTGEWCSIGEIDQLIAEWEGKDS